MDLTEGGTWYNQTMMNFGGQMGLGGYGSAFGSLNEYVWLVAGVLLIVWLWKQLGK